MALSYGTVFLRSFREGPDGPDAGVTPDRTPLAGVVVFSPAATSRRHTAWAADGDAQVFLDTYPVPLANDGSLSVQLPAGWWTVTPKIATVTMPPFTVQVLAGQTINLRDVAPVAVVSGQALAKGDPGPPGPPGSGSIPTGGAGGALSGTYPNPGFNTTALRELFDAWLDDAGGAGGGTAVDNGDGTFALTSSTVTDNGDGTYTITA